MCSFHMKSYVLFISVLSCGFAPFINNSIMDNNSSFHFGDSLTYSCQTNYSLNSTESEHTIQCEVLKGCNVSWTDVIECLEDGESEENDGNGNEGGSDGKVSTSVDDTRSTATPYGKTTTNKLDSDELTSKTRINGKGTTQSSSGSNIGTTGISDVTNNIATDIIQTEVDDGISTETTDVDVYNTVTVSYSTDNIVWSPPPKDFYEELHELRLENPDGKYILS